MPTADAIVTELDKFLKTLNDEVRLILAPKEPGTSPEPIDFGRIFESLQVVGIPVRSALSVLQTLERDLSNIRRDIPADAVLDRELLWQTIHNAVTKLEEPRSSLWALRYDRVFRRRTEVTYHSRDGAITRYPAVQMLRAEIQAIIRELFQQIKSPLSPTPRNLESWTSEALHVVEQVGYEELSHENLTTLCRDLAVKPPYQWLGPSLYIDALKSLEVQFEQVRFHQSGGNYDLARAVMQDLWEQLSKLVLFALGVTDRAGPSSVQAHLATHPSELLEREVAAPHEVAQLVDKMTEFAEAGYHVDRLPYPNGLDFVRQLLDSMRPLIVERRPAFSWEAFDKEDRVGRVRDLVAAMKDTCEQSGLVTIQGLGIDRLHVTMKETAKTSFFGYHATIHILDGSSPSDAAVVAGFGKELREHGRHLGILANPAGTTRDGLGKVAQLMRLGRAIIPLDRAQLSQVFASPQRILTVVEQVIDDVDRSVVPVNPRDLADGAKELMREARFQEANSFWTQAADRCVREYTQFLFALAFGDSWAAKHRDLHPKKDPMNRWSLGHFVVALRANELKAGFRVAISPLGLPAAEPFSESDRRLLEQVLESRNAFAHPQAGGADPETLATRLQADVEKLIHSFTGKPFYPQTVVVLDVREAGQLSFALGVTAGSISNQPVVIKLDDKTSVTPRGRYFVIPAAGGISSRGTFDFVAKGLIIGYGILCPRCHAVEVPTHAEYCTTCNHRVEIERPAVIEQRVLEDIGKFLASKP